MNRYPVRLYANPDPAPGRWLWLVKWLLLIPHFVVLAVLWIVLVVLTLVAYVAVLITGRYPTGIYDFNVGVLRWSWRVGYYGYQALGTDRYPPFALADVPDYPAGLDADPPRPLPRWRPLVAWLLAFPHVLIVAALTGGWRVYDDGDTVVYVSGGLVAVTVLIVGVALLFTGRHPPGLYALLVGVARWVTRTIAYIVLLTGAYPPFRLDQGAREPDHIPPAPDDADHRTAALM
ncbi:DUF4389 domain-containing protein [Phytohabitans rumicis]|nr:DUF4389 domain-containing protein [Phytohabitans rumicis]